MKPILAVLVLIVAASLDVGGQEVRSKVGPVSGTSLSSIIDPDKSVYGVEWGSSEDEFVRRFGNPTGYIRLNASETAMLYGKSHAFIFTASKLSGLRISMTVLDWKVSQSILTLTPFDGAGWQFSNGIRREMNLTEVKKILGESLKAERSQRYFNTEKARVEIEFAHYPMEGEKDEAYKLHGIYIRQAGSVAAVLRRAPVPPLTTTREAPILRAPQPAPRPAPAVDSNSPRPAFFEKARASIVAVTGEDAAGQPMALGSGFVIGENLIATSAGIWARRIHVSVGGQAQQTLEVAYGDSYRNATILTLMKTQTSALQAPPLVLGDSDQVRASDRVYFAGAQSSVLEGIIRNTDALNGENYFFEISARMTSNTVGGGPLFNREGEVIGILEQSIEGKGHLYAIPASRLKRMLQYRIGTPAAGGNAEPELAPPVAAPVEARPVLLKNAQPRYNEEARGNKTQGVINMSLLVGEDGEVKDTRITKGLPDGLNEQAIAAAKQMRFKPAVRDGHPVSFWQPIVVEFHLR